MFNEEQAERIATSLENVYDSLGDINLNLERLVELMEKYVKEG